MTPVLPLRAGAVIGLLFAAGHSRGAPWTPGREAAAGLIEQMKALHITVMGAQRSYWDFYFGFGLSISVSLFALALLLWQLGTLARHDAARLRPMLLTLAVAYLAIGVVAWKFIFVLPMLFSAVIVACIAAAWVLAGRQPAA